MSTRLRAANLVKANVSVKSGQSVRDQKKASVVLLEDLGRIWHPDRFARGQDLVKEQVGEESSKVIGGLHAENTT